MRQAIFLTAALGCAGLAYAQLPPPPFSSRTGPPTGLSVPQQSMRPAEPAVLPSSILAEKAPPTATVRENLITFDPGQVELQWRDNHWQLVAGDVVLKDFGRRQAEGREVQRLIRELGLNQLGTVGTPLPVMEYWLAGGRAPRGTAPGLRLSPLDLSALRVERFQNQWCLRDGPRVLFNFGSHAEEAEQALAIIRRYGFTHIGQVGGSPPAMTLFVSNPDRAAPPPLTAPASFVPRTSGPASGPRERADAPFSASTGRLTPAAHPERPSDLADTTDYVPFDWRQVQVRRDGQDWKLTFGSYTLANFGADERAARQALAAVRHYRFNQHCLVGRPTPVFSYFMVNGRAPHGLMFGLGAVPFRPEALTVRQVGGSWVIGDAVQTLIDFGDHEEGARQTLQVIQRHRFDHLCRVGPPGAALTFLVRAR